jgi:regulator of protease activity HflC (stomatin/prohibitin superfamily)
VSVPLIASVVGIALSAVLLAAGLVIVPAGHAYVTERLGRYDQTRDEDRVWIDGAVTLRRCIAGVDLDRLQTDRPATGRAVVEDMQAAATAWGLTVLRYDPIDIRRHNKESAA